MRSKGHARSRISIALVVVLAFGIAMVTAPASAEPPFVSHTVPEPTSLRWAQTSAEFLPYTEYSSGEEAALMTAQAALTDLPWGLVRNADHGYEQCAEMLSKMTVLRAAQPTIAGHELVLAGPETEARVFVYNDGIVRLLSTSQVLTPAGDLRQVSGDSERHAWEVAHSAMCLHAGLEPDSPYCSPAGSIAAYGVGFALEDGEHMIIRVDHDGNISCSTW
jgi:hypothetical protein